MPNFCACGCNLQVAYKGLYRKNHQPEGQARDPEGKQKRSNELWNHILKQKRLDDDIVYVESNPGNEVPMTLAQVEELINGLLNNDHLFAQYPLTFTTVPINHI